VRASLDGSFSLGDVLRGLDFVIESGADVANLSVAGAGFTSSQGRALEVAFLNDVLLVAASGNRGLDGNPLEFPAAALGGYRGRDGIGNPARAPSPRAAGAGHTERAPASPPPSRPASPR
jgi:hypothetical protein